MFTCPCVPWISCEQLRFNRWWCLKSKLFQQLLNWNKDLLWILRLGCPQSVLFYLSYKQNKLGKREWLQQGINVHRPFISSLLNPPPPFSLSRSCLLMDFDFTSKNCKNGIQITQIQPDTKTQISMAVLVCLNSNLGPEMHPLAKVYQQLV